LKVGECALWSRHKIKVPAGKIGHSDRPYVANLASLAT